jgi:hypothetical protein
MMSLQTESIVRRKLYDAEAAKTVMVKHPDRSRGLYAQGEAKDG